MLIEASKNNPGARLPRPDSHELLPRMVEFYSTVIARTGLAALIRAHQLHTEFSGEKTPDVTDSWKAIIDGAAADAMTGVLQNGPFRTRKVGSEGAKEIAYAGAAAPSVKGTFGQDHLPLVAGVSDVVEGTTPLSRLQPGASSVIAVAISDEQRLGITPVPEDAHYVYKFIGPPQARGVVDMQRPHEENLRHLLEALGIAPEDLTQVTMNPMKKGRECNRTYVDDARKVGVPVVEIDVGDFMPGVLATLDPRRFGTRYTILVGRGGYEEGVMSAAAARALGGFWQAREFIKGSTELGRVIELDEVIPASPEETLLNASFITPDNQWFNQPGIEDKDNQHVISTMIVTHHGIEFKQLTF